MLGYWQEVLNSDSSSYGGSNVANPEPLQSAEINWHGQQYALFMTLAPLAMQVFEQVDVRREKKRYVDQPSVS